MTLAFVLLALGLLAAWSLCRAAHRADVLAERAFRLGMRLEGVDEGEDISGAVGIGAGTSYEGQKVVSFRSVRHGE